MSGLAHPPTTLWTAIVLLSLFVVAPLVWWLRQRIRPTRGRQGSRLHVVESLPLGTRERLVVVQVGDEQLLLGIGAQGVQKLHAWSSPSETTSFQQALQQASETHHAH